jgi:hypothetical protein
MRILISLLVFTLSFYSCNPLAEKGDLAPYFDSKSWFSIQLEKLNEGDQLLRKTVDEKESVIIDIPNWEKELGIFLSYDLGHPAQQGKFFIQEYNIDAESTRTRYKSTDPASSLRRIEVVNTLGQDVKIIITDSSSNIMYNAHKVLTFDLEKHEYQIEHLQESRWFKPTEYKITGTFINK